DEQDGQDLQEVREGRRILERMRRVHVEEAAAVRAELLYGDLPRGGAPREPLLGHGIAVRVGRRFDELRGLVGAESLDDSLRDLDEREDQGEGEENVESAARQVDPEVAEVATRALSKAANERNEGHHSGRSRDEVLNRECE